MVPALCAFTAFESRLQPSSLSHRTAKSGQNGDSKAPDVPVPIELHQSITPSKDNTPKCNAYTPALNEPFDYASGTVKMRGVNLGGWLVLEPFITLQPLHLPRRCGTSTPSANSSDPRLPKPLLDKHYST